MVNQSHTVADPADQRYLLMRDWATKREIVYNWPPVRYHHPKAPMALPIFPQQTFIHRKNITEVDQPLEIFELLYYMVPCPKNH
jgi:hypothetical protein